ncbi:Ig-like domain-containing protein [Microvirga sp. TS319]|uniref:Ig-like domain-containing protein n=1 Tax=Microvirga sp. TS319 TaxID=3241165 RepID=UPI00351A7909
MDTFAVSEDTSATTLALDLAVPEAPTVALTTDSGTARDGITNSAALTIGNVADGATVEYQVEEGGEWSANYNPTGLADGEHTIKVRVRDADDNLSGEATITFTLDTAAPAAPTVALTTDSGTAGDLRTNDGALTVAAENGARVEYRLDNGDWSEDYDPDDLTNGQHTVEVRATDAAGNVSGVTTITFTLDTAAPAAPTVALTTDSGTADDDGITNSAALTIEHVADGDTVEYQVEEGGEWSTTYDPDDLADGDHTIKVRVKDAAGNVSNVATVTFTLDTTPPVNAGIDVDDLLTAAEATAAVPVAITPDNGAIIVSAKIDGVDLTLTDGDYTFDATDMDEGEHEIVVVTKDAAGNETTTTRTITIDRVVPANPTVALTTDSGTAGDLRTNDGALTIGNVADGDTVEYQVEEGGEWSTTYDPTELADGEHTVKVRVKDAVGNLSEVVEITFTLDTTAPAAAVITVDDHLGAAEVTAAVPVAITPAADAAIVSAKIGNVDLTLTATAGAYTFDATDLEDGTYTVTVVTKDAAGNETTTEKTVTIDRIAPTSVTLTSQTVSEHAGIGDVVGTLGSNDGGTHTFVIVDAAGNPVDDALFEIVENDEGVYEVRVKADLSEAIGQHTIRVRVSDGANAPHTQDIILTVTDENDHVPTDIHVTGGLVAEHAPVGKEFVTLTADDDDAGDTFTYTLVTDQTGTTEAQNNFFEIVGNKIKVKAALNDAQVGLHELWVKVTDAAGHSFVKSIIIGAYNTEEAPENVALTPANPTVNELAQNGTVVGDLTATDQDDGDHVSFRLVDDAGGRFDIVNGQIVVKNGLKLDYEQARSHTVTVEAKDDTGLVTLKTFTINLGNVSPEVVNGTDANETFVGGAGRDLLSGGAGKDVLKGGAENDTLVGGSGKDVLTGGTGRDSFVFNTALNKTLNVDTITDFSVKDDTIRLENAIFRKLTQTGTLKKDFFTVGSKAKDKNDHIIYDNKTGALSYDADGSGRVAAVKFAQLDKGLKMTNADFFVF